MANLREALEAALVESPDDRATHAAYADLLLEEGDPRGELIAVQLAVNDQGRSYEERQRLKAREAELLHAHQREWLGELATDLLDRPDSGNQFYFERGWLEVVELSELRADRARALAHCPLAKLLRCLTIRYADYYHPGYAELAEAPALGSLRYFAIGPADGGISVDGTGLVPVIARMARLEQLCLYAHEVETTALFALPLPNLRELRIHNLSHYPLEVLAANSSLGKLEHLSIWPHSLDWADEPYINAENFAALVRSPYLTSLRHLAVYLSDAGDEGVAAFVESGLLKRLKVLDLWNGRITDDGARLLASCPDLRNLERLRIAQNQLTAAGIEALEATGIAVEAEQQYGSEAIADRAHLAEGDIE
jgi:uncharacterized protein (TIGR02996 family)